MTAGRAPNLCDANDCYVDEHIRVSPKRVANPIAIAILRLKTERDALRDVLTDVAVYLDDQSDVIDGPEDQPMPNKAMQLLREVERVLAQVKN